MVFLEGSYISHNQRPKWSATQISTNLEMDEEQFPLRGGSRGAVGGSLLEAEVCQLYGIEATPQTGEDLFCFF